VPLSRRRPCSSGLFPRPPLPAPSRSSLTASPRAARCRATCTALSGLSHSRCVQGRACGAPPPPLGCTPHPSQSPPLTAGVSSRFKGLASRCRLSTTISCGSTGPSLCGRHGAGGAAGGSCGRGGTPDGPLLQGRNHKVRRCQQGEAPRVGPLRPCRLGGALCTPRPMTAYRPSRFRCASRLACASSLNLTRCDYRAKVTGGAATQLHELTEARDSLLAQLRAFGASAPGGGDDDFATEWPEALQDALVQVRAAQQRRAAGPGPRPRPVRSRAVKVLPRGRGSTPPPVRPRHRLSRVELPPPSLPSLPPPARSFSLYLQ
jgi:hypothetical protein